MAVSCVCLAGLARYFPFPEAICVEAPYAPPPPTFRGRPRNDRQVPHHPRPISVPRARRRSFSGSLRGTHSRAPDQANPLPIRGPPGVLSFAASGASSVRRRIPPSAGAASTQSSFWAATTSRRPSLCSSSTRRGQSASRLSTIANSRRPCYNRPLGPAASVHLRESCQFPMQTSPERRVPVLQSVGGFCKCVIHSLLLRLLMQRSSLEAWVGWQKTNG